MATSSKVKDRYNAKAYDRITFRVPKGLKPQLELRACSLGLSLNAYLFDLVIKDLN